MLEARPCVAGLRINTRSHCRRAATHGAPSYDKGPLNFRCSGADIISDTAGIFLEILIEQTGEHRCLHIVLCRIVPCVSWIEQSRWNALARLWNHKVEHRHRTILHFIEFSFQCCGDHGSCIRQFHSVTHPVCTTRPACVDQPYMHVMLLHFFTQQLRIFTGMQWHEWCTETSAERGLSTPPSKTACASTRRPRASGRKPDDAHPRCP